MFCATGSSSDRAGAGNSIRTDSPGLRTWLAGLDAESTRTAPDLISFWMRLREHPVSRDAQKMSSRSPPSPGETVNTSVGGLIGFWFTLYRESKYEKRAADGDGGVGEVVDGPSVRGKPHVDEIDDMSRIKPIDQVA